MEGGGLKVFALFPAWDKAACIYLKSGPAHSLSRNPSPGHTSRPLSIPGNASPKRLGLCLNVEGWMAGPWGTV